MVGKGVEPKSSRIFHQCYLKCCKLQNLTPLTNVIPHGNGKVLDFCVDRIKYPDWPPILNALSCDLSLHSVSIKCRQPSKTVLEHIDCERLAKTVNNRAVILTNFMLSNIMEASSQLLSNTTLLSLLMFEGLPLKIPYLNPLCEALLANSSLQHLYLTRCLVGDAGCLAICKAVRCLPNILTLDLSGCELTAVGAGHIADLVKYQKIHRYSENWVHTLRYRLPDLDTMAGLRRITVCGNPQLGDLGASKLIDVLADDLWIKAMDVQNCGLTEQTAASVMQIMNTNTTLVVLDLRHNAEISSDSLAKIRAVLREKERGLGGQYSWLGSTGTSSSSENRSKSVGPRNIIKDKIAASTRITPNKYVSKANVNKKERDYTEVLEEQLQEEISHRQQLEELNLQLVDQMKQLKQQQIRLWANNANSSGSEQSSQVSSRSGDLSSSSGSFSSVPIDQNTLSYIQQAFKDIYAFIKNNQCHGQCIDEDTRKKVVKIQEVVKVPEVEEDDLRINIAPKKAQSTHLQMVDNVKMNKTTKSAHLLGEQIRDSMEMKADMIERKIGDMKNAHGDQPQNIIEDVIAAQVKLNKNKSFEKSSPCSSVVSDSSDTLVCSPSQRAPLTPLTPLTPVPPFAPMSPQTLAPADLNPREAFYSSDEDDDSS